MMLVLNNLLMVAEIKMNENLKARNSLNSWKLKLQQETHEEGRQQMIEAWVLLEKSYEGQILLLIKMHQIKRYTW